MSALRKALRAVERHVLDEVREAALRIVLENGAGVHDEPELGALQRQHVAADQVVQTVGQLAAHDRRIERQPRRQVGRLRRNGKRDEKEHRETRDDSHVAVGVIGGAMLRAVWLL